VKPLLLIVAGALLGSCPGTFAALDELPNPEAKQSAPPRSQAEKRHWRVRVEVLMAALPQDKCLALLPDLRDPRKIDTAITQILASIARKEAILTGYPLVQTVDGNSGTSETALEKRYPTEFTPPQIPQTFPVPGSFYNDASPTPTAFEVRPLGPRLNVTPTVSKTGDSIRLQLVAERSELLETAYVNVETWAWWRQAEIAVPQFLKSKDTIGTSVKNGEHVLIGVHPLFKPEGYIEVFILQAVATQLP